MNVYESPQTNSILNVAQQLMSEYQESEHKTLSLEKLQYLLYFANRQCLAKKGYPLFRETMIGEPDGILSPEVCAAYRESGIIGASLDKDSPAYSDTEYFSEWVISVYGLWDCEELKPILQEEYSWQQSRKGLFPQQEGNKILLLSDMMKDAKRVQNVLS